MVFIRFLFKILDQVGSPFSLLLNFLSFNNLFYISYLCFLFYSGIFTSLSEISLCPFSLFLFHLSHFLYPIPLYLRFFFSSSYSFLAIRQGSPGGWKKGRMLEILEKASGVAYSTGHWRLDLYVLQCPTPHGIEPLERHTHRLISLA